MAKSESDCSSTTSSSGAEDQEQTIAQQCRLSPRAGRHWFGTVDWSPEGSPAARTPEKQPGGTEGEEPVAEADLLDYGRSLGVDINRDVDLRWVVKVAFAAALPPSWSEHMDEEGRIYFFNRVTLESSWSHPMHVVFREILEVVQVLRHERAPSDPAGLADFAWRREEAVQRHLEEVHRRASEKLEGWSGPYASETGTYYHNASCNASTWDNPVDEWRDQLAIREQILRLCLLPETAGDCPSRSSGTPLAVCDSVCSDGASLSAQFRETGVPDEIYPIAQSQKLGTVANSLCVDIASLSARSTETGGPSARSTETGVPDVIYPIAEPQVIGTAADSFCADITSLSARSAEIGGPNGMCPIAQPQEIGTVADSFCADIASISARSAEIGGPDGMCPIAQSQDVGTATDAFCVDIASLSVRPAETGGSDGIYSIAQLQEVSTAADSLCADIASLSARSAEVGAPDGMCPIAQPQEIGTAVDFFCVDITSLSVRSTETGGSSARSTETGGPDGICPMQQKPREMRQRRWPQQQQQQPNGHLLEGLLAVAPTPTRGRGSVTPAQQRRAEEVTAATYEKAVQLCARPSDICTRTGQACGCDVCTVQ